jgi:hypothetical protein
MNKEREKLELGKYDQGVRDEELKALQIAMAVAHPKNPSSCHQDKEF